MAWANILAPIPPVTAKPPVAINEKNVVAAVDVANINAVPPATTGKKTRNYWHDNVITKNGLIHLTSSAVVFALRKGTSSIKKIATIIIWIQWR